MDGKRIQVYLANEARSLLTVYRQFQTLLPDEQQDAASHKGEDGRYVESLVKSFLSKFLPQGLEVFSGFIYRPAVKTGTNDRGRKGEKDAHSTQLDIIVYDRANYPVFQQFENNAIVPPEGVVAIISVKKKFHDQDFCKELNALKEASALCRQTSGTGKEKVKVRGPFLCMVAMDSVDKVESDIAQWIFDNAIYSAYENDDALKFDDMVGLVTNLGKWSIFKTRPEYVTSKKSDKKTLHANYISFYHKKDEEHLGLQFLLSGILSVYYDETRNRRKRPGFTAFPSGRKRDRTLGYIESSDLR